MAGYVQQQTKKGRLRSYQRQMTIVSTSGTKLGSCEVGPRRWPLLPINQGQIVSLGDFQGVVRQPDAIRQANNLISQAPSRTTSGKQSPSAVCLLRAAIHIPSPPTAPLRCVPLLLTCVRDATYATYATKTCAHCGRSPKQDRTDPCRTSQVCCCADVEQDTALGHILRF